MRASSVPPEVTNSAVLGLAIAWASLVSPFFRKETYVVIYRMKTLEEIPPVASITVKPASQAGEGIR